MSDAQAKRGYKTERELWRMIHGSTKVGSIRREHADRDFSRLFPEGHATSLRPYVRPYVWRYRKTLRDANDAFKRMEQFHPEACKLLFRYGVDYAPCEFDEAMVHEKLQPRPGRCQVNSQFIMDHIAELKRSDDPIVGYAEGLAMGSLLLPILHAWNTVESPNGPMAWDWSCYAFTKWCRYFGIPFSKEEYDYILTTAYGTTAARLLLDRDGFMRHREPLLEVLAGRTPYEEKPAA